ncbi:hypothetical protein GCM10025857_29940 [Alicyclobacillus contaminans]|uniref:HesB/YadR/YfhF family protein n=1 Tax=Alicyclobacillus contaminans TaxID=392016 RepID=UPI000428CCD2|nr:HesB/YadR/YfhF family protein [Alicyclobacillus contaminans]GMA51637.1 hypothetical protein GCM10025857_29940 [Alicyclobacillus contaminans]
MQILITQDALEWFRQEVGLNEGDALRFFAKYGGQSRIHPGFSIGMTVERPSQVAAACEAEGILFFVRESDAWFFNDGNLRVDYDRDQDELIYDIA